MKKWQRPAEGSSSKALDRLWAITTCLPRLLPRPDEAGTPKIMHTFIFPLRRLILIVVYLDVDERTLSEPDEGAFFSPHAWTFSTRCRGDRAFTAKPKGSLGTYHKRQTRKPSPYLPEVFQPLVDSFSSYFAT